MKYKSILECIGNTPLIQSKRQSNLYMKVELFNPAGSAKDRVALNMVNMAEKKGILKQGSTIIEPTSGNTGIGLALVSAYKGYDLIITMPDTMSVERQNLMKAYGAKVVLTPGSKGMKGSIEEAERLHAEIENSWIAGQFDNLDNPQIHYETTGPEIWKDMDGSVDCFVAGVGTGGTISGVGKFLKEKNPDCKIVAVEPMDSPLLSKGVAGPHKIQGIGANFIPNTLNTSVYDEIVCVESEEAFSCGRALVKEEGILVGISSGASYFVAEKIAKENPEWKVVVVLPDSGERYLSTEMFR